MFKNANLSVIAYANGWTQWHYVSNKENLADIARDNYFDPIFHLANTGDVIIINGLDFTTMKVMRLTEDRHVLLEDLK